MEGTTPSGEASSGPLSCQQGTEGFKVVPLLLQYGDTQMSDTIQMRTTSEQSGDYRVYAAATVNGEQPVKGFAIHQDIAGRLDPNDYVEAELSDEGAVALEPDKATSATVRMRSANGPAVRHVYVSPEFLSQFGDFEFDGEDTDLDSVPALAISSLNSSTEEEYETDKQERSSAEDAANALLGESDDSDEQEADDSDEERVELSDEEVGLAE